MELLGVNFEPIIMRDVLVTVQHSMNDGKFLHIMTVNPEYLVEADKNKNFKDVLINSDLKLIDGFGLLCALSFVKTDYPKSLLYYYWHCFQLFGRKVVTVDGAQYERIAGVDFIDVLLNQEWINLRRIMLLGGEPGIAEKAKRHLEKRFPDINFFADAGHKNAKNSTKDEDKIVVDTINAYAPDILLVAYGNPWQDVWINKIKNEIPSLRVAIGVGGTLDFLSGEIQRAPRKMRRLGLEWLFRLLREPSRIGRIYNAVVAFPELVLRDR